MGLKGEKKKEGAAKKDSKKDVKVEPEPEPEDMISSVKSRRLMAMQAKKDKEEMDRQNKGKPCRRVTCTIWNFGKFLTSGLFSHLCYSEKKQLDYH